MILTFISGYTAASDKSLKIDPENVVGMVDMHSEVTAMLEDLGYEWHPILNDSTQQKVKVAKKFGQYRVLFKMSSNDSLQIELHVRETDNMTGLHFSEIGTKEFTDTAMDYYRKLKERAILEYGAENVSEKFCFMIP